MICQCLIIKHCNLFSILAKYCNAFQLHLSPNGLTLRVTELQPSGWDWRLSQAASLDSPFCPTATFECQRSLPTLQLVDQRTPSSGRGTLSPVRQAVSRCCGDLRRCTLFLLTSRSCTSALCWYSRAVVDSWPRPVNSAVSSWPIKHEQRCYNNERFWNCLFGVGRSVAMLKISAVVM